MAHITEGSPIKRVNGLELAESPDSERIIRLAGEFPGKVELIPAGSTLFHYSRDLRGLVNRGVFDYKKATARDGGMHFSDLRATSSNCSVKVAEDLVMFMFVGLTDEELTVVKAEGGGDHRIGGAKLGFDGQTFVSSDQYTWTSDTEFGTEVVVFKPSLRKLGKITPLVPLPHPISLRR